MNAGLGRREFVAFLSMLMALAAVGIDLMLPAFDEMRADFGLAPDSNRVATVVTAYLLGMAVAPLLYGSLADRFGRRPVLWLGGLIYIAGAVASALAPTLPVLLVARFLWGFGAAGGRVVAFAIVRDTQQGEEMARTMSYIMAVFVLVPVVAPSLGALIVAAGPWRWVFWSGAMAAAAVLLWSTRLGETLTAANRQPISAKTIRTTAARLAAPATLAPLLALVCLRGVMATYLASSELIISAVFDRGDQFPVIFGAVAAVMGAASFLNGRLLSAFRIGQIVLPVTGVYLVAGFTALAVTLLAGGRPGFWLFMPILTVGFGCQMLLAPNFNTLTLEPMGDVAGTASALVAMISTAGGAVLGAVFDARFSDTATPLTVALSGSGVAIIALLSWSRRVALAPAG